MICVVFPISQCKHCSGKGRLVIYVDNTYTSKVKRNINMHESWEGLIDQITGSGLTKTVTLGNIYRPPRSRNDTYIHTYIHPLQLLQ